jgi:hypothetical protein
MRRSTRSFDSHIFARWRKLGAASVLAALVSIVVSATSYGQFGATPLVDLPGGNFSNEMFTSIQNAPGRPNDLFISRADGTIFRYDLNTNTESTFLTLPASEIDAGGGYWGLLGFTFAPDFATSGNMYVHVADDFDAGGVDPDLHHRIYIRRYTLTNHLSDTPTLSAPTNLLRWDQGGDMDPGPGTTEGYGTDHSGGWIGFQPGDPNTLWISSGDTGNVEGEGRDFHRTGQDPSDLRSGILRINVNGTGDGEFGNYAIPSNNPNATGNPQYSTWAPEVWSIGLRSPWGGSFDRSTGDFLIGDVGASQIGGNTGQEEVNFERADSTGGRNYGWRIMEGSTCPATQDPGVSCDPQNPDPAFTMPVYDYEYGGGYGTGGAAEFDGRSVTGGYVYRGPVPELQGKYIFGDWSSHQVWALEIDRDANGGLGGVVPGSLTNLSDELSRSTGPGQNPLDGPTAFGEDAAGNLYILELGGRLHKICEGCAPPPPPPPPDREPTLVLSDQFSAGHNYRAGSVPTGGIWTDAHNELYDASSPFDVFDSNTTNAGNLTIGHEPVGWGGGGADNAPFLHREVDADQLMDVTIRIQSQSTGNWSSAGILIRADGPLDSDSSNDNFLTAHAFRPSSSDTRVQVANVSEGNEGENNFGGLTAADVSHLRVVNQGNGMFEVFSSADGSTWISRQTYTNENLATGTLEVGVWAGTYGGGTSSGTTRFDWVEITLGVPAGDFNEDGMIDAADYVVWRKTAGQAVTAWDGADGNGDATVDDEDFAIWKRNFGTTIPNLGSGSSSTVPESGSALLLVSALGGGWKVRRRSAWRRR